MLTTFNREKLNMTCNRQCGARECKMKGRCLANETPPQPDPAYLYQPGDIVRHRFSGEIIGQVIKRIDRDYIDDKGVCHKHSFQSRTDEKIHGLGSYPSYLMLGLTTGNEFEWTQRDKRLFAEHERIISIEYEQWSKHNDK